MQKFKKTHYISQRLLKSNLWTFQVFIRKNNFKIIKNFSEKEYGSARAAYDAAIIFRDNTLKEIRDNSFIASSTKTVKDVLEESFLLFPLRAETKRKHRIYLNRYILDKDMMIQKLMPEHIQMSLNNMIETCTDETIQRVNSIWKRITKTAVIKRYINRDIGYDVVCPQSTKVNHFKHVSITNKDTLIKMISCCKESINEYDGQMYECLLWTLYYTGMRPAEAIALNKNDVDLKNKTITINKEIGSSLNEFNVIRQTKTKLSNRIIPINDELIKYIERAKKLSKNEILFSTKNGNHYSTTHIGNDLHVIAKKNDLQFSMYALRHLFSTDLIINNNVDVRTVQELMGHSNPKMTIEYARSDLKTKIDAIKNR